MKEDAIYEVRDGEYSKIIDYKDILLRGRHNYENICTCLCIRSIEIHVHVQYNKPIR